MRKSGEVPTLWLRYTYALRGRDQERGGARCEKGGSEGTASEEEGRLAQNSYEPLDTCHQQDRDQESYPNDR